MEYFTPDIEDIRVGYECEIQPTGLNPPWSKYIISTKDCLDGFVAVGFIPTAYGTPSIRVPYLTREQIEAEGWINDPEEGFLKKGYHLYMVNFIRDNKETRMIAITFIGKQLFSGECKDINTFRYICKLLNIK